jgi:hypothetical protein
VNRKLICLAYKGNFMQQLRQTDTTGKSLLIFRNQVKRKNRYESKIFYFRSHPNQPHNSARLAADEGRWPSSRTRGEMRWTLMS